MESACVESAGYASEKDEARVAILLDMVEASSSTYKWKKYKESVVEQQSARANRKLSFGDALRHMLARPVFDLHAD